MEGNLLPAGYEWQSVLFLMFLGALAMFFASRLIRTFRGEPRSAETRQIPISARDDSEFGGRQPKTPNSRNERNSRNPLDGQFTRAPARKFDSTDVTGKTFADVAGNEEAIAKLMLVKGWLEDPELFQMNGAKLPKGILLVGPPGTGKTLLVKALAGEGDATLFSISGSDFVEMFVGVGASRVRDLFQQARDEHEDTKKPVVIFIDEIDAVGKRRSGGGPGSNDEREQTLNQLLVEMDGFAPNQGIMLIAATNRVDTLDPALKRPGRFDYQIYVDLPDFEARAAIFGVHMRGKPVAKGVDAKLLASRTPGYSGADIEAACNEAATLNGKRLREQYSKMKKEGKKAEEIKAFVDANPIPLELFDEGIDVVQLGEARQSRARVMSLEERKQTAYHEAGHAAVMHVRGGDPVTKITIMPRARSLGHTQATPVGDRFNYTEEQLHTRIMMAMGGRVAQEVFMKTVDTGASSDFQQASTWAKKMVTEFGMSPLGPIFMDEQELANFGGAAFFGPDLQNQVNREWLDILRKAKVEATRIIEDNRDKIELVVAKLLEKETILGPEFKQIWDGIEVEAPEAIGTGAEHPMEVEAPEAIGTGATTDAAPALPAAGTDAEAATPPVDAATTNGTAADKTAEGDK